MMVYSDFTLKKVKTDFNIKTIKDVLLFTDTPEVKMSDYLQTTLARNVPLAIAMNTEKARRRLFRCAFGLTY